ncbi:MAG: ATP-binding protein [Candidatus Dormibacteria bacterium]
MSLRMRLALASAVVVAGVVAVLGGVVFSAYSSRISSGSDGNLKEFLTVFIIAGASAILLAVVFGWLGARSASRRLTGLSSQLGGLAAGRDDLSVRVPVPAGKTEMAELSQALNASLARIDATSRNLQAALGDQRRFLAEASRRLRAPLTSMATGLQVLRRRPDMSDTERDTAIERTLGDIQAMTQLVDGLDLLARMGSTENLRREAFEWGPLLENAITAGRRLCAPRPIGIDVSPSLQAGLGDPEAIQELVRILFTNVAVHTPQTSTVTFSAGSTTWRGADADELTVADDGPGVPTATRERMFEPFVTGGPGRSAGLGLAVARAIATSLGGAIEAGPNSPRGLRVRVVLPRAPV